MLNNSFNLNFLINKNKLKILKKKKIKEKDLILLKSFKKDNLIFLKKDLNNYLKINYNMINYLNYKNYYYKKYNYIFYNNNFYSLNSI
jgi:hypothetical protein